MEGSGRLKGESKGHGYIHSQKLGVDLTGIVEQGNDFFLLKLHHPSNMHIPTRNPRDEGVDIDSPDDAPLGSLRLG